MNIYLDVDGVLIKKNGELAEGIERLIEAATSRHTAYWLTTRCKGDAAALVHLLKAKLPQTSHTHLDKIHATNWDLLKTEAIDFSLDFLWLDDYLMDAEMKVLESHDALDKQILINLKENPRQLVSILEEI